MSYWLAADFDDNKDRENIFDKALIELIIYTILTILWAISLLNFFPLISWGYGYVYHTPHILSITVSLIVSYYYYIPLVYIGTIIRLALVITDFFALGTIIYAFVICFIQSIPVNCKNSIVPNVIVIVMSILLVYISINIFLSQKRMLSRLLKSEKITKNKRKRKSKQT
jgi:hypothetical protein